MILPEAEGLAGRLVKSQAPGMVSSHIVVQRSRWHLISIGMGRTRSIARTMREECSSGMLNPVRSNRVVLLLPAAGEHSLDDEQRAFPNRHEPPLARSSTSRLMGSARRCSDRAP
jgi:hypothetical protein